MEKVSTGQSGNRQDHPEDTVFERIWQAETNADIEHALKSARAMIGNENELKNTIHETIMRICHRIKRSGPNYDKLFRLYDVLLTVDNNGPVEEPNEFCVFYSLSEAFGLDLDQNKLWAWFTHMVNNTPHNNGAYRGRLQYMEAGLLGYMILEPKGNKPYNAEQKARWPIEMERLWRYWKDEGTRWVVYLAYYNHPVLLIQHHKRFHIAGRIGWSQYKRLKHYLDSGEWKILRAERQQKA